MNRKQLYLILGLIIVILLAVFFVRGRRSGGTGSTASPTPVHQTVTPTSDEATYNDPGGRFSFVYPKSLTVTGPKNAKTIEWRQNATTTGYLLASLTVPKSYMPGTNFSDAKLTVGSSNDPHELGGTGCPSGAQDQSLALATAETIGDQTYTKVMTTGAAAGNLYETTSYFTVRDGDCYDIEYTIHSTNIGNYDPSQGVKEFDKAKLQALLDRIVESFVFKIKSD